MIWLQRVKSFKREVNFKTGLFLAHLKVSMCESKQMTPSFRRSKIAGSSLTNESKQMVKPTIQFAVFV